MGAHTTANVGKRLTVWLKDGSRFTAKLESIRSQFYIFQGVGKVQRKHIRTLVIAR